MVDQRHTLPNLKYLLTVLTAGKGDLPVRKKVGVRVLDNGGTSEQREDVEKSPLMNGKQPSRDNKRIADEIYNT